MTEEPEVTRLLRAARAREPMPDDVVARLDATLADLVAARETDADAGATVTPLRPRRYRTTLIAAAAAVIAIGAGGAYLSQLNSPQGDSSSTAAKPAESEASADLPTGRGLDAPPAGEEHQDAEGYSGQFSARDELSGELNSLTQSLDSFEPPLTKREQRRIEAAVVGALLPALADSSAPHGNWSALSKRMAVEDCAAAGSTPKETTSSVFYYLLRQTSDTPRVIDVLTCQGSKERILTSVTLPPRE